jgi:hypothetical protein
MQSSFMRFTPVYNQSVRYNSPQPLKRSKRWSWMTTLSTVAIIGMGTSFWVLSEAINLKSNVANASQIDRASTKTVDLYVERWPNETYDQLWQRAENAAIATVQQSFDREHRVSKVVIMVTAENDGSVAPIFTLKVTRNQWASGIQPDRWITSVPSSETLLGFEQPKTAVGNAPSSEPLPPNAVPNQQPGSPL